MMTAAEPQRAWYLLQCKPKQEFRALAHLQNQGFRVFLPTRRCERRRNGRLHECDVALFPSYAFVHLDRRDDNWSTIRSTRGVLRMVTFDQRAMPVPDAVMQSLFLRQESAASTELLFSVGDKVRIAEGALSGLDAVLAERDDDQRVVLLLNLLQREQRVVLPLAHVMPMP